MDINRGLVVSRCREHLTLLGGDGCVSINNSCANSAEGLKTEGERCYVEEEKSFDLARENTALKCCAKCYALIGVDALEGVFSCEVFNCFLNCGDSRRTAYEKDFIKLCSGESCIGKCLTNGAHCCFDEVCCELVELCSCEGDIHMLGSCCICGDEGEVYSGLSHTGKLNLSFLSSLFKSLHCHLVRRKVDAGILFELADEVFHNSLVEVVTTEAVVTCGCKNLLHAVAHLDDGNVECTAAEVVYHNLLLVFFINAVCKSCCGRLVDNSLYLETCYFTCVLCCLTLCVGEVGRNCDNSLCYCLSEVCLCISLELLENHCRNLLGSILFAVDIDVIVRAHISFYRDNCSIGVGYCLTLCNLTDKSFTCFLKSYYRRGCSRTVGVWNYDGLAAFHYCYTRVCCTQVNTNNLAHNLFSFYINDLFFIKQPSAVSLLPLPLQSG